MLLVILGVGLLLLAAGIITYIKKGVDLYNEDQEWVYYSLNISGSVITVIMCFALLIVGICYSDHIIIEDKIELYQTENAAIEEQISAIVTEYKDFESGVIEDVSEIADNSPVVLVTMYPELKSNELVSKQIDLYVENNAKIRELEVDKLNYRVMRWWLCFGN